MTYVLLDAGFLIVNVHRSFVKKGTYYRCIPKDLRDHKGGKQVIRKSLQASQPQIAAKNIEALAESVAPVASRMTTSATSLASRPIGAMSSWLVRSPIDVWP